MSSQACWRRCRRSLIAFYTNSISPSSHGNFYELYAIAAAVVGGCSLRGGEGSIGGIIIGAALLQVIRNLVNLLDIPGSLDFAVMGAVILIGAVADQLFSPKWWGECRESFLEDNRRLVQRMTPNVLQKGLPTPFLSEEWRIAIAPEEAYTALVNDPAASSRLLARLGLIWLLMATIAAVIVTGRITVGLLVTAALSWSFVLVLQMLIGMLVIRVSAGATGRLRTGARPVVRLAPPIQSVAAHDGDVALRRRRRSRHSHWR